MITPQPPSESEQNTPGTPESSVDPVAARLAELESMILRDRNHPSVYMWSLSNEESVAGTPKGRRLYRAMVAQFPQEAKYAVALGARMIRDGDCDFVLAGGVDRLPRGPALDPLKGEEARADTVHDVVEGVRGVIRPVHDLAFDALEGVEALVRPHGRRRHCPGRSGRP